MPTPFRDFIPAGEDTGAQGSGFKDFVPPSESAPTVTGTETPTVKVEAPVKSKKELVAEAEAMGIETKGLSKKELLDVIEKKNSELGTSEVEAEPEA